MNPLLDINSNMLIGFNLENSGLLLHIRTIFAFKKLRLNFEQFYILGISISINQIQQKDQIK